MEYLILSLATDSGSQRQIQKYTNTNFKSGEISENWIFNFPLLPATESFRNNTAVPESWLLFIPRKLLLNIPQFCRRRKLEYNAKQKCKFYAKLQNILVLFPFSTLICKLRSMQTKKNERSAKLFPQDLKLGQVHESMLLEITHFTKKRIEQKLKQKSMIITFLWTIFY